MAKYWPNILDIWSHYRRPRIEIQNRPYLETDAHNLNYWFFQKGHFQHLFLYDRLFYKNLTRNIGSIEVVTWLDSNRGPLVSEATALPTSHNHCPILLLLVSFLKMTRTKSLNWIVPIGISMMGISRCNRTGITYCIIREVHIKNVISAPFKTQWQKIYVVNYETFYSSIPNCQSKLNHLYSAGKLVQHTGNNFVNVTSKTAVKRFLAVSLLKKCCSNHIGTNLVKPPPSVYPLLKFMLFRYLVWKLSKPHGTHYLTLFLPFPKRKCGNT